MAAPLEIATSSVTVEDESRERYTHYWLLQFAHFIFKKSDMTGAMMNKRVGLSFLLIHCWGWEPESGTVSLR